MQVSLDSHQKCSKVRTKFGSEVSMRDFNFRVDVTEPLKVSKANSNTKNKKIKAKAKIKMQKLQLIIINYCQKFYTHKMLFYAKFTLKIAGAVFPLDMFQVSRSVTSAKVREFWSA